MFVQRKLLAIFVTVAIALSLSFVISGVVAQSGDPFAHPSDEIVANLGGSRGLSALGQGNLDALQLPSRTICEGAYSCMVGINADGSVQCASTESNIFGAGKCDFEEKKETYSCGKGTCEKSWTEWQCQHTTDPNAGCEGDVFQTCPEKHRLISGKGSPSSSSCSPERTTKQAIDEARESAGEQCCPCGETKGVGPSAGMGTHYKGYFCSC